MTAFQFGTMMYIKRNEVTLDKMRHLCAQTLSSLLYHNWITLGKDGTLHWTHDGDRAMSHFGSGVSWRSDLSRGKELSPSVMKQLKHYRVIEMRKRA